MLPQLLELEMKPSSHRAGSGGLTSVCSCMDVAQAGCFTLPVAIKWSGLTLALGVPARSPWSLLLDREGQPVAESVLVAVAMRCRERLLPVGAFSGVI